MKSLRTIQTLCRVLRIICKVLFILCIVGAAGCLTGFVTLLALKNVILFDGKTLGTFLAEKGENIYVIAGSCLSASTVCGLGIFLAKYNELFFAFEVAGGNPFRKEVGPRARKVALTNIIASCAGFLATAITVGIFSAIVNTKMPTNGGGNGIAFAFGIALLVISFLCDYGTELREAKEPIFDQDPIENETPKE